MKKVISNTKDITIDELVDKLQSGAKILVFYYTKNKRDGVPVFLIQGKLHAQPTLRKEFYFQSPVFGRGPSYSGNTIREALEACAMSRGIYMIESDSAEELFIKKP